ncbi:MAG: hypothetical protein KAU94_04725, partial [Verrucomicrobia bacterium]|nr:hypothetical protein [Verrucomicrobiota bacterium]
MVIAKVVGHDEYNIRQIGLTTWIGGVGSSRYFAAVTYAVIICIEKMRVRPRIQPAHENARSRFHAVGEPVLVGIRIDRTGTGILTANPNACAGFDFVINPITVRVLKVGIGFPGLLPRIVQEIAI